MSSRPARIVTIVVGVLALLIGGVWTAQGSNLMPGSGMSGQRQWLVIGLVVAIVGVLLLVRGFRRPRTTR
ncbi:hypothetical protein [uncultured Friedmanniella sp.]|uniref:hypothetical protein n=1 Tax=uncultured Friedmanniella sp. TaxID=335381 RepID=UPI0035CC5CA9